MEARTEEAAGAPIVNRVQTRDMTESADASRSQTVWSQKVTSILDNVFLLSNQNL